MSGLQHKDKQWDDLCNTGWDKEPDQQIYVALLDKENDKAVLFSANVVEANLVEVGRAIANYKLSDKLPNWLNELLTARKTCANQRRRVRR